MRKNDKFERNFDIGIRSVKIPPRNVRKICANLMKVFPGRRLKMDQNQFFVNIWPGHTSIAKIF